MAALRALLAADASLARGADADGVTPLQHAAANGHAAAAAEIEAALRDDDDIGCTNRSCRRCRTSKALERSLENETEREFWERNEEDGILASLFNACVMYI